MASTDNHPVILFDGVCNLCNTSVQWVLKRDKNAFFRFAALQSDFGQQVLTEYGLDPVNLSTVVLLKEGRIFTRSEAALEIAGHLGGAWPLLKIFKIVPLFIRDAVYNWVGRNRYRWFGQKETCWIPTPELRARFL